MTDAQLRRRYRLVMTMLVIPPAVETAEDDLELHRCALEMEAARRGLELDPTPAPPPQPWSFGEQASAFLLALFVLALVYCVWP